MKRRTMKLLPRFIATLGFAAISLSASAATFKEPVGLQLYSLRAEFTKNVPAAIEKAKGLGFRDVELAGTYNLTPETFRGMLKAAGLNPVAGHFAFDRYEKDPEAVAKEAKALGLKFAGLAWIPHKGDFTEADARHAADVFNKAGEVLKKHGIQFYYHVHGYEFQKHGDGTLFDLLMKETKPDLVAYQMDVLWVVFPAQDPVALLEKYGSRWQLMHIKDLKKGVKTGSHSGGTDVANDVAIGTGQMDWPAILKAAKKAGVKHYFIEDESPSVLEQIPQSLKFLKTVSW